MPRIWLVRHGRATAGWNVDPDPGLDSLGVSQAADAAKRLAPFGPLAIVSSPLRRCRETAAPLVAAWASDAVIESGVAEIPSPEGVPMADRVDWLRAAMNGTWTHLGEHYMAFRDGVVDTVRALPANTVVFSHFVAINAVIGAVLGDDRVVIRSLDNCSATVIDLIHGELHLVEAGHEADTLIR